VVSADARVVSGTGNNQVLVSDDFSHIYFASPAQLVPGRGEEGAPNVYALSGGQVRFIGIFDRVLHSPKESLLSADGNLLTFQAPASRRLTADEVAANCLHPGGKHVEACEELYRYDDSDGSIECISCAQGALTTHTIGSTGGTTQPHDFQMSADGTTVAFATQEQLLPRDVNRDVDIYKWRNGSLGLVTDGVSDRQDFLAAPQVAGIDATGSNILFSVLQPGLTGFERDGLANVYDARIGGGFEPPAAPVHCSEDSCQGPLQAPPTQQQPSSAAFSGRGNAKEGQPPSRCAKGKVRRRGRCVSRHPHKRHHKRASHANQGRTK